MLNGVAAVFDERQREGRLNLKVLAALPANDDPAPVLGGGIIVLEQHRLAHAPEAGQPDVAREGREAAQVLFKAPELGGAVRQVGWVQPHSGPERVDARGRMITFWLHHLLSIASVTWNSARSRSSPPSTPLTSSRSSEVISRARFRRARASWRQRSAIASSRLSKVNGSGVSRSLARAPSTSRSRSASRRLTARRTSRCVSSAARSISSVLCSLSASREI